MHLFEGYASCLVDDAGLLASEAFLVGAWARLHVSDGVGQSLAVGAGVLVLLVLVVVLLILLLIFRGHVYKLEVGWLALVHLISILTYL